MATPSAIRDIHVVIDSGGELRPAMLAADLARQLDAHLTGISLAFQPIIPVYTMAAPVPTDFIVSAHEHAAADAKAALAKFSAIAEKAGVVFEAHSTDSMPGDGFIGAVRGFQLTDLAVIGQQDPDRLEPMREGLIEALMFQAGAPVLLVPHNGSQAFKPDRVVIAWDGGPTAARAVRFALPLLKQSKEVIVVTIAEPSKPDTAPGTMIARYLARHDLNVETIHIDHSDADIASAILRFAVDRRADWMVMGAYGHSRVREFFLGGATRGVLSSATLPVFMAH